MSSSQETTETTTTSASTSASAALPDHDALIERRKALIRETWGVVEANLNVSATEAFYLRLFEKYPDLRPMFAHADMRIQAMKLYEVLRVAVRFLDNFESLTPILEDMGIRHAESYGVQRDHYHAMTDAFIEILNNYISKQFAGDEFSGSLYSLDVAHAWSWALTMIGTVMADAADDAGVVPGAPGGPMGPAAVSPKSEHSFASTAASAASADMDEM
jgi:nitric oxide dioxygenase